MTLSEKQRLFTRLVGELYKFAYKSGYELTFGNSQRCKMTMKQRWAMTLAVALLGICAFGIAYAQTVTKTVTFSWTLPLTDTNGNPAALTKVQLVLSTATIPDSTTIVPIDLAAGVVTNSLAFTVPPGGTVFGRVRACNSVGCSSWSNEASKAFPPVTVPLPPTNVTVVVSSSATSVER